MYFRQFLHADLGCASYLVAGGGEAAVIDPKWEIDDYLSVAAAAGAEIRHVLETHNHADHVSGRRRLVEATGATAHVPHASGSAGIRDGDVVPVGDLELLALATPGHRPEHVAYALREHGTVRLLLSGDSLLVGDVARPDLAVDSAEGAEAMWHTLQRLVALGDDVELWPAHVGGSLCASRSASAATSSTIGHERRTNALLSPCDPATFVSELTRSIPSRPPNVERVVALNVTGAADPGPVRELSPDALARALGEQVCVLDIRDPESFDRGHLEGAINLPPGGSGLGTRAGWAVRAEDPIVLVAPSIEAGRRGAELLRAAGVWNLVGVAAPDPAAWKVGGLGVRTAEALRPEDVLPGVDSGTLTLLDVREPDEWRAGHIQNSRSLPLSELGDGRNGGPVLGTPIVVVCAGGARAAVAASVLRRRGHDPVWRVSGGVEKLARLGAPVVRESDPDERSSATAPSAEATTGIEPV